MKQCKDCRFFTGKICNISERKRTPEFSCFHFASNTSSRNSRMCKDCRFYDGKICAISDNKKGPEFSCMHFSPYR